MNKIGKPALRIAVAFQQSGRDWHDLSRVCVDVGLKDLAADMQRYSARSYASAREIMRLNEVKEYRLHSAGMIYAPGIINYLSNMYHFESGRAVEILTKGWPGITEAAAEELLEFGNFTIEGDTIVFHSEN